MHQTPGSNHLVATWALTPSGIIRRCSTCGTQNRIPPERLSQTGKCGACHSKLSPINTPLEVDTVNFQSIVGLAKVPVLVDFWASWCGPCRMVAPEVHALAKEMSGQAIVLKVDTERFPELAAQFHVQGIPNFVLLKNGRNVFQQAGAVNREQMKQWFMSV